jgi:hypothetical protein
MEDHKQGSLRQWSPTRCRSGIAISSCCGLAKTCHSSVHSIQPCGSCCAGAGVGLLLTTLLLCFLVYGTQYQAICSYALAQCTVRRSLCSQGVTISLFIVLCQEVVAVCVGFARRGLLFPCSSYSARRLMLFVWVLLAERC